MIPTLWLQRFHAGATAVWIALMAPSLIFWPTSVPWLVAMSVWANVAGHFASWMGARSEAASTPVPSRRPVPRWARRRPTGARQTRGHGKGRAVRSAR